MVITDPDKSLLLPTIQLMGSLPNDLSRKSYSAHVKKKSILALFKCYKNKGAEMMKYSL